MIMASKKESVTLEKLIPEFGEVKEKADSYKKDADSLNKKIKELISKLPEDKWKDYAVGDWTVTYRVDGLESMNEEKLIELLKTEGLAKGIIKRKEYIDEQALENAIYNNLIPKKVITKMDKCKEIKTKQVLTVKKIKRED